jgi:hypothetical protein
MLPLPRNNAKIAHAHLFSLGMMPEHKALNHKAQSLIELQMEMGTNAPLLLLKFHSSLKSSIALPATNVIFFSSWHPPNKYLHTLSIPQSLLNIMERK